MISAMISTIQTDNTPPSPSLSSVSLSSSWMKKSSTELIPMLKDAYSSLKDKERDLRLAAEIGKSLLENNLALKSNYEGLLNSPYPTPTNSTPSLTEKSQFSKEEELCETGCNEYCDSNCYSSAADTDDDYDDENEDFKYVPYRTREAMVEILEKQNHDLKAQLEVTLNQHENDAKLSTRKSRQLETQIEFLQTSLDYATNKINEIEEQKKNRNKTLAKDGTGTITTAKETKNTKDETVTTKDGRNEQKGIDENEQLEAEIEALKQENTHTVQSKEQVEKRLTAALQDLRLLRNQFEQFNFTAHDHQQLKKTFEIQFLHMQQLKQSLEEHRSIISKLKERGVHIPSNSSLGSCSSSKASSFCGSKSSCSEISDETRSGVMMISKNNLLTELENAWYKHQTNNGNSSNSLIIPHQQQHQLSATSVTNKSTSTSLFLQPFQAIYNQLPNVDSALESILLKAGVVEKDALDDALSLIGRLEDEYNHEKFMQEKRHLNYEMVAKRGDEEEDLWLQLNNNIDYEEIGAAEYGYYAASVNTEQHAVIASTRHALATGGIVGYAQEAIRSMIYMTWKWLRFTIIMTVAIFITVKEGPDALQ